MPITIIPAAHKPRPHPPIEPTKTTQRLLRLSCLDTNTPKDEHPRIIASSFGSGDCEPDVYPSSFGLVRGAIEAWAAHSHFVLRPDDIWFAILMQINLFLHANPKLLPRFFTSESRYKKYLHVSPSDRGNFMDLLVAKLRSELRPSWMGEWISPGFSTSTSDDEITATLLMMGMMKTFVPYDTDFHCGIPSITLLGTKQDWQGLLAKIDRLDEFGEEPTGYAHRLRPILSRIAGTFDHPMHTETKVFWDRMVQAKMNSDVHPYVKGQYIVSGWILGFFYWDSRGILHRKFAKGWASTGSGEQLEYDQVHYGQAALDELPAGYAKAEFTMWHAREGLESPFEGWVLAGSIGKHIVDGAPKGYHTAVGNQPYDTEDESDKPSPKTGRSRWRPRFLQRNTHDGQRRTNDPEPTMQNNIVQGAAPRMSARQAEPFGTQSTLHPASGWFMFGPKEDVGDLFDTCELSEPTKKVLDQKLKPLTIEEILLRRSIKPSVRNPGSTGNNLG